MTTTKSKSQTRKERTLATRRRMVGAAYRLFCANGYVATTMEAIAREADVAVPTLYFTFHSKGAILGEALGAAVMGLDEPVGPEDAPWYGAFEAEPDPRLALKILVENTAVILRRVGPLTAAIHGAANDPEVAAVYDRGEQRRYEGYRDIVRLLARKGGLRQGLTVARATDMLFVLLGPQLVDALASGRGWSAAECNRWLVEVLSQQLLPAIEQVPGGGAPGARAPADR
jgi:AcrR family transcriptional regulator